MVVITKSLSDECIHGAGIMATNGTAPVDRTGLQAGPVFPSRLLFPLPVRRKETGLPYGVCTIFIEPRRRWTSLQSMIRN
jgi:hypothetical protein